MWSKFKLGKDSYLYVMRIFFFWTNAEMIGTSGKLPLSVEDETLNVGFTCELENEQVEVCFQIFLYFLRVNCQH